MVHSDRLKRRRAQVLHGEKVHERSWLRDKKTKVDKSCVGDGDGVDAATSEDIPPKVAMHILLQGWKKWSVIIRRCK